MEIKTNLLEETGDHLEYAKDPEESFFERIPSK